MPSAEAFTIVEHAIEKDPELRALWGRLQQSAEGWAIDHKLPRQDPLETINRAYVSSPTCYTLWEELYQRAQEVVAAEAAETQRRQTEWQRRKEMRRHLRGHPVFGRFNLNPFKE